MCITRVDLAKGLKPFCNRCGHECVVCVQHSHKNSIIIIQLISIITIVFVVIIIIYYRWELFNLRRVKPHRYKSYIDTPWFAHCPHITYTNNWPISTYIRRRELNSKFKWRNFIFIKYYYHHHQPTINSIIINCLLIKKLWCK